MKSRLTIISIFAICIFFSCKKGGNSSTVITPSALFTEYRDPFIGNYKGTKTTIAWNSNIAAPPNTTFNFEADFVKSTYNDSVIEASNLGGIHLHANGSGYPTGAAAATQKNYKCSVRNDSLYYYCFIGNSGTWGLSTYFSGKKQ